MTTEDQQIPSPMVDGKHLMAWVAEKLQAAGAQEEDPICGLLVECVHIARGDAPRRDLLAACVEWATNHYTAILRATPPHQDAEGVKADPWEITDEDWMEAAEAVGRTRSNNVGWSPLRAALKVFRDRLRARVQPRRVSRERLHELSDWLSGWARDCLGDPHEAEADEAARVIVDEVLGIEIEEANDG